MTKISIRTGYRMSEWNERRIVRAQIPLTA
jgi:hypothetical protein